MASAAAAIAAVAAAARTTVMVALILGVGGRHEARGLVVPRHPFRRMMLNIALPRRMTSQSALSPTGGTGGDGVGDGVGEVANTIKTTGFGDKRAVAVSLAATRQAFTLCARMHALQARAVMVWSTPDVYPC